MERLLEEYTEALDELIDARIAYDRADPEWRSSRDCGAASARLSDALAALLTETVRRAVEP